jgi:hypothetical protein
MNVAKLSASTRMALNNNFGFPKGENGTIGAFVKVSKNIDKELKDLGATIPSDFFGQARGELFGIRFPINSLDKISEIDGLVYLDIGEKMNTMNTMDIKMPQPAQFKTPTPSKPISDLEYYTSANFLKSASFSVVPVALIGAYSYHKKFSLTKTALLISIPIVVISILQKFSFGSEKNAYWSIFSPPSIRQNHNARIAQIEKTTGVPQKGYK